MNYGSDSVSEEDSKNEIIQPEFQQLNLIHQAGPSDSPQPVPIKKHSWISNLCECFQLTSLRAFSHKSFPLLKPQSPEHFHKNTLVLDLDETLVHSSFSLMPCDTTLKLRIEGHDFTISVLKRPGVDEFLKKCTDLFEVVIFTASLPEYANPLIDSLDPESKISFRLFRQSCVQINNSYVKDLSRLGRNLNNVIIVDVIFN